MSVLIDLMRVALGVNLVLLVGLLYVWVRNYLQFRSKHTFGLSLFGVFLLGENALALYFFAFHPVLSPWVADPTLVPRPAQIAMLVLRLLELVAIGVLLWTTWD
ncbi:hypothetical protein [Halomarina pelagica]|uniref:hypothetical protein n=1 Tax=Halomarina pelagica TaxID=2961599 RepID=UPI0020C2D6EA|nr:hypothetical protein [Halomarina sp. BND7]